MIWNRKRKEIEQRISELEEQLYASEMRYEELKQMLETKAEQFSNGITYCGNVLADHAYQLQQLSEKTIEIAHYDSHAEIKLKYLLEKEKPVRPRKIVQVVLDLRYGDAIGNDIIAIHRTLKKWGYDAEIYAEHVHDRVQESAGQFAEMPGLTEEDILLFHFGGYCDFADLFEEYECKKVLVYHNITPAEFFEPGSQMEEDAKKGRVQLRQMWDKVDFCIADSEFNKQELEELGFQCPIYVLPILLPFTEYQIIEGFSVYHKKNPHSCLTLAGGYAETDSYYQKLQNKIKEEKIENVFFTGHIRFEELIAYYRSADVYLCLSEHEGFCVPLLEASFFEIPIIAYDAGAVPGTLDGAGVLLEDKAPERVADEIDRILNDENWKRQLIDGEKVRLAFFSEQRRRRNDRN